MPHSTQVAGYAAILGGDDRLIGNIFLAGDLRSAYGPTRTPGRRRLRHRGLRRHPASLAEYLAQVDDPSRGDHERFKGARQPVYIRDNVYAAGAGAYDAERDGHVLDDAQVAVVEDGDEVYLETQLPEAFDAARVGLITGGDLERVRFVDAEFEEPDGSPARLDTDLVGNRKTGGQTYAAGPLTTLASGSARTRVW